ncbi:MAG: CoA-binding protein [Bacteroidales bacterium]
MMENSKKKTLVIGASENPERYAFKAVTQLVVNGHPVIAFGSRAGKIGDVNIETHFPKADSIHTVTMYLGPKNQQGYYDLIESLSPRRVIFNPGTENPEFADRLNDLGIETLDACTLVLLATKQY